MTIVSQTTLPTDPGSLGWSGRLAALAIPWVNENVIAGVPAGAANYSPSFDVRGRNKLRLDVKNVNDATVYVWATTALEETTTTWHKIWAPTADTVGATPDVPLEILGGYSLVRVEFNHAASGGNAGTTPRVDILAVYDPNVAQLSPVSVANGGTGAALSPAAGALPYSTATALALLAAGTSGQLLASGGAAAPAWASTFAAAPLDLTPSTSQIVATAGTINTAGFGTALVAPAGAVTGVIMQAGTVNGQVIAVVNTSANSVTFAAAGTSNVADGVSDVIAGSHAALYVWNSALWYRVYNN